MAAPTPNSSEPGQTGLPPGNTIDIAIRLALIGLLAWLSLRVFAPFLGLMVWALVLAIAFYPLNTRIARRLGGSNGGAATLLVLLVTLLIGVPTVLLGMSFVDQMLSLYRSVADGSLQIPPPRAGVAEWPLIGAQVDAGWRAASENLEAFLAQHSEQLRELSRRATGALRGGIVALLSFVGAFIIAGIMMAYAQPGRAVSQRILVRICGPRVGPELHTLSVSTVRSVAMGVVGVAFIQAVLLGMGFLVAGIPAAGVLSVGVLILSIMQIPAALFFIPAIIWLWTAGDSAFLFNVLLTIYMIVAGLADNVLKPMLLGRGVSVPMPAILLGALGGMISGGLIGLFVGAVVLAVAYQVFMAWVNSDPQAADAEVATAAEEPEAP